MVSMSLTRLLAACCSVCGFAEGHCTPSCYCYCWDKARMRDCDCWDEATMSNTTAGGAVFLADSAMMSNTTAATMSNTTVEEPSTMTPLVAFAGVAALVSVVSVFAKVVKRSDTGSYNMLPGQA